MQYQITGTPLPVVTCTLQAGEKMITESGAMSWMSPNMRMETSSNGGIGKALGRMFSGERLFQNIYTAEGGQGMIAFASSFPGTILDFQISPANTIIVQKRGFLAAEAGVELSVFVNQRIGSGLFGGEGFIMQKLSGNGTAFVEIDGSVVEYDLAPGQQIIVDTGILAAMSETCTMSVQQIRGVTNVLFGGEGLFNTVITGPGKVYLQSMPINMLAGALRPYFPSGNG
ncbi:MAG: TIGR00266 family protein [Clostridia bacterium]|nr:TIGR00266 family protein [Clostridia bacterium]MBQ1554500.1 TIGR00266 family protein [Clostridia bacterium]MBQ4397303.1 TIGR00266 family protein [Clostridia bacterium]